MVPSSIQWTMTPSVHILVYPISRYVISPVIKSPGTTVKRRGQRHTSTPGRTVRRCSESRVRRSLSDNCGNRLYRRSQQYRRMQTYPPKRSPYRRRNGRSRSRCDKRCGSRDTCSRGLRSAIHHRGKQAPQDRKQEQDEDMNLDEDVESDGDDDEEEEGEEDKELEVEIEDCDSDGDDHNIIDDDYDDDDDNDQVEDDGDDYEEQLVLQWPGARKEEHKRSDDVDDATITCGWAPQPPPGETQSRVMRRSANVVLLAHGNRSLYVLTIQRNQVTSVVSTSSDRYRNRRSSSTTVISYKLPGGQFILTDDEQQNYHKDGKNTCIHCPDDQQWYSAAINHFMTQLTTRGPTTSATTTMMATTTGQAVDGQPQFMTLGNWYRTQQDNDHRAVDGPKYDRRWRSNSNYYPYKPAHVSRQLAGHKRVYAVPDAGCLFPASEHTFQLQTPHAKIKTATIRTKTATTKTKTTTVTTTYKCKFVPLARLHENSRLYGPVLSSLPAVLSGMNLICSP